MNSEEKNIIRNGSFNFYKSGTVLGILGGIGMAFIALLNAGNESVAASFVKYLAFIPFLYWGLSQLQSSFIKGNFVKEGILYGMYTSLIAGITFGVLNLIEVLVGMKNAEKFTYEASSMGEVLAFQGINFFEVLGLGSVLTLICLQFLKFRGRNEQTTNSMVSE